MSVTLFKDTTYNVTGLIENIRRGEVALPDIQRPFVWAPARVRQLFDSMYRGFPVGYLLFWATGAEAGARQIGAEDKAAAPRMLIVDGQQRLTALFAVMTGVPVLRKDFTEGRIRIAFCPAEQTFEVTDAAIEKDPEFIPDITEVWKSYRETTPVLPGGADRQRRIPQSRVQIERSLEPEGTAQGHEARTRHPEGGSRVHEC